MGWALEIQIGSLSENALYHQKISPKCIIFGLFFNTSNRSTQRSTPHLKTHLRRIQRYAFMHRSTKLRS